MSYTFAWGDGSADDVITQNTAQHVYATPGDFAITATTPSGAKGTATFTAGTGGLTVAYLIGVDNGQAIIGGGPSGGVRLTITDDVGDLDLSLLASVNWGDGHVDSPPDISGGFVAHVYTSGASGIMVAVRTTDGRTGWGPAFNVVSA